MNRSSPSSMEIYALTFLPTRRFLNKWNKVNRTYVFDAYGKLRGSQTDRMILHGLSGITMSKNQLIYQGFLLLRSLPYRPYAISTGVNFGVNRRMRFSLTHKRS